MNANTLVPATKNKLTHERENLKENRRTVHGWLSDNLHVIDRTED